jgi:DNA-directed RNA polymerase specialized sigma subunit
MTMDDAATPSPIVDIDQAIALVARQPSAIRILRTGLSSGRVTREQVEHALARLDGREQRVLSLRLGLRDGHALSHEGVGREFGLTGKRIRQIETQALRKLGNPSRSRKLRKFPA